MHYQSAGNYRCQLPESRPYNRQCFFQMSMLPQFKPACPGCLAFDLPLFVSFGISPD